MTKAQLVSEIASKSGLTKADAEKAVNAFTAVVTEQLGKGDRVQLVGFGTFEVSERPARKGINPKTKESITVDAYKLPKFKAGKLLKEAVNA